MPTPDFDLYLVTDRGMTQGRDLLWVLQQALDGGVKGIQLREKDLVGRELFFLAEAARKLTQRYHALLLINDRIDIALAVDADGVHLSTASIPIESARALLGRQQLLGASTHSLEEAQEAERNGADFVMFGPVYFTPSKASYGSPQGLAALKKVVEKLSLPIYAIGGIKLENIADTRRTGVRGVALISAVMSAADPENATKEILKLFNR
ncbi:MAG TPA: thiamine phosphate synthase [Candidatus Binatia bacterium]|nr:thiamine phosphate synthase [Candidatus Binatia bacterium]